MKSKNYLVLGSVFNLFLMFFFSCIPIVSWADEFGDCCFIVNNVPIEQVPPDFVEEFQRLKKICTSESHSAEDVEELRRGLLKGAPPDKSILSCSMLLKSDIEQQQPSRVGEQATTSDPVATMEDVEPVGPRTPEFTPLESFKKRSKLLLQKMKDKIAELAVGALGEDGYPVVELPLKEGSNIKFYRVVNSSNSKSSNSSVLQEGEVLSNQESLSMSGVVVSSAFYDLLQNGTNGKNGSKGNENRFDIVTYLNMPSSERDGHFDEAVKNLLQMNFEKRPSALNDVPFVRIEIKGKNDGPYFIKKEDLVSTNFEIDGPKTSAQLIKGMSVKVFHTLHQSLIQAAGTDSSLAEEVKSLEDIFTGCQASSCLLRNERNLGIMMMDFAMIAPEISKDVSASNRPSYNELLAKEICLLEKLVMACEIEGGEWSQKLINLRDKRYKMLKISCRSERLTETKRQLEDWGRALNDGKGGAELIAKLKQNSITSQEILEQSMQALQSIEKRYDDYFERDNQLWIEEQRAILKQYFGDPNKYDAVVKDQLLANRYYKELIEMKKKSPSIEERNEALSREVRYDKLQKEVDLRDREIDRLCLEVRTKISAPDPALQKTLLETYDAFLKQRDNMVNEQKQNLKERTDKESKKEYNPENFGELVPDQVRRPPVESMDQMLPQ